MPWRNTVEFNVIAQRWRRRWAFLSHILADVQRRLCVSSGQPVFVELMNAVMSHIFTLNKHTFNILVYRSSLLIHITQTPHMKVKTSGRKTITFFCCWLSSALSKRSTLEMSRLSLHRDFRPDIISSVRETRKTQRNFTTSRIRFSMWSRGHDDRTTRANWNICFYPHRSTKTI